MGADPKPCSFIVKDRFDPGFRIHEPSADRIRGMVQQEIPAARSAFSKPLQIDIMPKGFPKANSLIFPAVDC